MRFAFALGLTGLLFSFAPESAEAKNVTLKLGTLAPEGSVWHRALVKMGARFKETSQGKVQVKIYPGGVAGNEGDLVRKMRIGQLQAATVTGLGLGEINRIAVALQLPMVFSSWEQLDCVRGKMATEIESQMLAKGFVVLNWGDAGWAYHFAKTKARSPDDFRKLKYFVPVGDPETERAWRAAKFQPVPLSSTDVMAGLQTNMIEAFATPPIFALSSQWFGLAKHMIRVPWSPLNGATVVNKSAWESIDPELRAKLAQIATEEGNALRQEIRDLNDKAVNTMKDKGLNVYEPTPAELADWKKVAELAYPEIRGKVVSAEVFDQVLKLAGECKN